MAAVASISDVINRMTGGAGAFENWFFFKDWRIGAAAASTPIVGVWQSMWQFNGQPAGGSAPGAVAAPTRATTGALMQANPGGGRQKWLTSFAGTISQPGTMLLYDRLLHISGLSGTSTGAQTVGGAITRNTSGAGNQIWVEIYTQIGASSTTITASYTNQSGVAGQTSVARLIGATNFREAQRMLPLPLAAGDTGVQSVQSVTLAATTGTAGDFGVTIVRPLMVVGIDDSATGWLRDTVTATPGPVEIVTDACLSLAFLPNAATTPNAIFGVANSVES